MGRAAIKSGLSLETADVLYNDLLQAQYSLVLSPDLHLLYLITPYDIAEQISITNSHYYALYCQLSSKELEIANILGFTEAVAVKLFTNVVITELPQRVLRRFYVTLILNDMRNAMPLSEVATKFDVHRGFIQNLLTTATTFASNVLKFCEQFEDFWSLALLLKGMRNRLSDSSIKELIPLMALPGVKQNRARQLFRAGYKTLRDVAKANPDKLKDEIEYMSKLARQIIAAAKLIFIQKAEDIKQDNEAILNYRQ